MGRVGRLHCRRPVRRKGGRSLILERTVRPQLIVVRVPLRQFLTHILEREEDFHVQTLIAEPPIKTFDESVLDWLARSNKVELRFGRKYGGSETQR